MFWDVALLHCCDSQPLSVQMIYEQAQRGHLRCSCSQCWCVSNFKSQDKKKAETLEHLERLALCHCDTLLYQQRAMRQGKKLWGVMFTRWNQPCYSEMTRIQSGGKVGRYFRRRLAESHKSVPIKGEVLRIRGLFFFILFHEHEGTPPRTPFTRLPRCSVRWPTVLALALHILIAIRLKLYKVLIKCGKTSWFAAVLLNLLLLSSVMNSREFFRWGSLAS